MRRRGTAPATDAPDGAADLPKAASRRGGGPRVLVIVAGLLVASAAVRLGDGVGRARAATGAAVPASVDAAQICAPGETPAALLQAIRDRTSALDARESAVGDREKAVGVAGAEIDRKLAALVAAEEKLARTVKIADAAAGEDVARLVSVYEKMKPKEAAPLFAEMAPDFAAGFLARMRPDAAAAILAGLDPKAAYTISVVLAGRNAAAPGR